MNLPAQGLPGGLPIRAFGVFNCKVADHMALIDKVAGIRNQYTVDDVKERVMAQLDPLLMKWISKEGKDMFNLQANASEIGRGICMDLDMEIRRIGIAITGFSIQSVSYPEESQRMINKTASQSMVGDMGRYQQMAMADSMERGGAGGHMAADMAGMQMGMMMGQQMMEQMKGSMAPGAGQGSTGKKPNFCPNCGTKTNGANFCPNCGQKL